MAIATFASIAQHIGEVSSEEIGRCHKVFGPDKKAFYQVENEAGHTDEHGDLIEYKVTYSKDHGFQCSCKCGEFGFWNVSHASGVCKHVRWSVAAALEEKAALKALAQEADEEKAAQRKQIPVEVRWNLPAWMLTGPVASHMKYAPSEL